MLDSVDDSVVIIETNSSNVLYANQAARAVRIRTAEMDSDWSWSLKSDQMPLMLARKDFARIDWNMFGREMIDPQ